jgi:hypothetical protein
MAKRTNRKRTNRKRTNRKRKKSIRKISKKKYGKLLRKQRLSLKEKKTLDRELFLNYCKCVKKIKYDKNYDKGLEYPICMNSIYKNRNLTPPERVAFKCKEQYY